MTLLADIAHQTREAPVLDQTVTACVAGGRLHPPTDGLLCRDHLEELGEWLHDIETEAGRLAPDPDDPDAWTTLPGLESRWDAGGGQLASQLSPAVLDAIVQTDTRSTAHGHRHIGPTCPRCRHDSCELIRADADEADANAERLLSVVAVVHGWAEQTRDERILGRQTEDRWYRYTSGPQRVVRCATRCTHPWCASVGVWLTVPARPSLAEDVSLLVRQLDWIAGRDWITAMRRELADLRAQLQRTTHNQDDQPMPGWCPRLVDGGDCGGNLWPDYPHESNSDPDQPLAPRAVVCDRDPTRHRWRGGAEVARLSLILDDQRRAQNAET